MSMGLSGLSRASGSPENLSTPGFKPALKTESASNTPVLAAMDHSSSLKKEIDEYERLNNEARALEELRNMDLLPLLLDLIENLKAGKISPKDFDNAVSLDESTESRIKKMEEMKKRIGAKQELLKRFSEEIEAKFGTQTPIAGDKMEIDE
ncbi:hypothetical protein KL905_001444 [Ogataea polymorpha]|nr:hypothetical protein KL937_002835 [Ogataea polymorpha]KAG7893040.1 hypothetical protein KL936_001214 [Ogataea polymorpha]KAG7897037.1 hypothetical protein KL908_000439 [Ogataea polymorpha]KAG7903158.1 hypothetical protein KL935_000690 [Ogataea polymorpha]KAG7912237.1 hypothetical protein KL906_000441 [Ogataea polymorpha]